MRTILTNGCALVALAFASGLASAADVASVEDWTGWYLGLNTGFAIGSSKSQGYNSGDEVTDWNSNDLDMNGGLYGLQIGADYQFSGGIVAGIRATYSFADVFGNGMDFYTHDDGAWAGSASGDDSSELNRLGTITARLGFEFADGLLAYGQGGFAWGDIQQTYHPSTYDYSYEDTASVDGWTLGAGFEKRLTEGTTLFLEGNYIDFGKATVGDTDDYHSEVDLDLWTINAGLNVRF